MIREGMTIRDAAEKWVQGMNAIPQGMIEKLMRAEPDEWSELTVPAAGDPVYVYDLPEGSENHYGEIHSYDEKADLYCIELDNGSKVSLKEENFEVQRDGVLPMWGTMWSFGDSADDYWLEKMNGIAIMSRCGFRIYESQEFGYFFGIDGAGYSFYAEHWVPLYRARGLQWHDPKAEQEQQMRDKGYRKGKLGGKTVWLDEQDNVVEEAS